MSTQGTLDQNAPQSAASGEHRPPRRGSFFRKIAVSGLAALAACCAVVNVSSPASAAAPWVLHQLDRDACADSATMDANYNGLAEEMWVDLDNDCKWDTHLWNSVGADNLMESLTFDMDENGRWEIWLADSNQRVGYEAVYFDVNGDGYYDKAFSLTAATNSSTTDLFSMINANNGIYHTYPTFVNMFNAALSGSILG